MRDLFIRSVSLIAERIPSRDTFPFSLPVVRDLDGLELAPVTYFVGENGSGKSTILEGIAIAADFNAEGGTKNFRFSTRASESPLGRCLRLSRGRSIHDNPAASRSSRSSSTASARTASTSSTSPRPPSRTSRSPATS